MKELKPQTLQVYPVQCLSDEDEINLVDLLIMFRKHKKVFVKVFLTIIVLGLLVIALVSQKYDLKTSLEIGTSLQNDVPTPIEAPETVMAKLENSYVPLIINRLASENEDTEEYEVDVIIPKKSTLVVMKSVVKESEEKKYKDFHWAVVEAIVSDHRRMIDVLKKKIQTELELAKIKLEELRDPTTLNELVSREKKALEKAKAELSKLTDPVIFGTKLKAQKNVIQNEENQLASLRDERKVLAARLERITSQQDLIRREIETLQKRIDESLGLQLKSVRQATDPSSAMSQLLIDSQITEDRKWLAKLKEQLYITLEDDKARVKKALEDNARSQELVQARIEQAKGVLEQILRTNRLEQSQLQAQIDEIQAKIERLINQQKRLIQTQEQAVGELLARLENFVETRAVVEPTRSPEPVSLSRKVLLLILLAVAGVLATVAVFIEELTERVRVRESSAASS